MLDLSLWRWWHHMGFRALEDRHAKNKYELEHVGQDLLPTTLADALAFTGDALKQVREAKQAVGREFHALWQAWFRTPVPGIPHLMFYQVAVARGTELGGFSFVMLEGILAAAFSVQFLRVSQDVAITVGIVTTALVAVAVKGVVAPLLLGPYEQMPRAGRKPMLVALAVMFPIEMFLLGLLVFARSVSTDATDMAFNLAAALITLSTPLIAAIMFALSTLLGWSGKLVAKWDNLSQLERLLDTQHNFCLVRLATIATQPSGNVVPPVPIKTP